MKKLYIIWTLVFLLLISLVSADDLIFKRYKPIDLKVSCFTASNSGCDGSESCQISVLYPNSSSLVDNALMSITGLFYNYTLTHSSVLGEYRAVVNCSDPLTAGFTDFNFFIMQDGTKPTSPQSLIYIGLLILMGIILIVCVYAAFTIGNEFIQLFFVGLSYILLIFISLTVSSISIAFLNSEILGKFFTAIFKLLTLGLVPLFFYIMMMAIIKFLKDKRLKDMIKRGIKK